MNNSIYDHLEEALSFIRQQTSCQPVLGIVLGTGLSDLAKSVVTERVISYEDIPHLPMSTAPSHGKKLIFGTLGGISVAVFTGRFHYYEGHSPTDITFPIRLLAKLGVNRILMSNAAGSTNPDFHPGDLVFLRDHINLNPFNPLRGHNDERLGTRFPDMLHTYDRSLNAKALTLAKAYGFKAHEGVYLGWQGPSLETPAEYNMIHRMGADLVGMSTVPEVIVARHMGIPVFVASVVTNRCYPIEELKETTEDEVIAVARASEPRLTRIIMAMLAELSAPVDR